MESFEFFCATTGCSVSLGPRARAQVDDLRRFLTLDEFSMGLIRIIY